MARPLQTRHVIPMLRDRGLRVHRESLAEVSDLLGLKTRPRAGNEVQRSWSPAEVELIALALTLRQRWLLSDDDLRRLVADQAYAETIAARLTGTLDDFGHQLAAAEDAHRWDADSLPDADGQALQRRTTAA